MYSRQFFVQRFRDSETEELLDRLATADLTQEAKDAIRTVLGERGIRDEDIAPLMQEVKKASYRTTTPTKQCDFCGKSAGFWPVRDGGQKFCNTNCLRNARLMEAAVGISDDKIRNLAREIRSGACPRCGGRESKIEVRKFYWVWSAVFFTRWGTSSRVCCARCGVKLKFLAIGSSALFGWWGFPWGVFMTPVQIALNVSALFQKFHKLDPSEDLLKAAKLQLAAAMFEKAPSAAGTKGARL